MQHLQATVILEKVKKGNRFRFSYFTKESRINATRNVFSRVGVKIWKGIPATLKTSAKKSFKESLKGKLFDILETVDSYIEVDTIIDQMKN